MADADALTTLDDVRSYLGIDEESSDLVLLDNLIDRVTDRFESYCDRKFKAADYTEYHDGKGRDVLFPKQWPINSVASIHDDPDHQWDSDTLIDPADYVIVDSIYVRLTSGYFLDDIQNVRIVYNGGYSVIPADLAQAAIEQVAWLYRKAKGQLDGVRSRTLGDGSVSYYATGLLPEVKEVLERYRRRGLTQ